MRALTLLLLLGCGAQLPAVAAAAPDAPATADAGVEVPVARCYCCWPAYLHGPGRCRFTRAASAPADECESDPEQRCAGPDAGPEP